MGSSISFPRQRWRGFAVVVIQAWQRWALATNSRDSADASELSYTTDATMTQANDLRDFESFFRRYEPQIAGYLRRMTGDEQAADDLSQETFFRAWQRFAEVRDYPRQRAWLFRVATNLTLNYMRHARVVGVATPLDDENTPIGGDPASHVAESELVHQTLLLLPPRQRALLVLREVYGLSCEEAGPVVGMSPANARKMLSRAREQFRQLYLRKDRQP